MSKQDASYGQRMKTKVDDRQDMFAKIVMTLEKVVYNTRKGDMANLRLFKILASSLPKKKKMKTLHSSISRFFKASTLKTKLQIHEEIEYQSGTKELIFLWNDSVEFVSGDPAPQGGKVATRWGA